MSQIQVRGVDHYYEWIKQPSDSAKPVMVFIHGWAGSARYWQSTATVLAAEFDCLLYDMRGFGRSGGRPTVAVKSELVADSESVEEKSQAIAELTYELGVCQFS